MSIKDEIFTQWMLSDENNRTGSEAEKMSNEVWDIGLRLNRNKNTHYQLVMDLSQPVTISATAP